MLEFTEWEQRLPRVQNSLNHTSPPSEKGRAREAQGHEDKALQLSESHVGPLLSHGLRPEQLTKHLPDAGR